MNPTGELALRSAAASSVVSAPSIRDSTRPGMQPGSAGLGHAFLPGRADTAEKAVLQDADDSGLVGAHQQAAVAAMEAATEFSNSIMTRTAEDLTSQQYDLMERPATAAAFPSAEAEDSSVLDWLQPDRTTEQIDKNTSFELLWNVPVADAEVLLSAIPVICQGPNPLSSEETPSKGQGPAISAADAMPDAEPDSDATQW